MSSTTLCNYLSSNSLAPQAVFTLYADRIFPFIDCIRPSTDCILSFTDLYKTVKFPPVIYPEEPYSPFHRSYKTVNSPQIVYPFSMAVHPLLQGHTLPSRDRVILFTDRKCPSAEPYTASNGPSTPFHRQHTPFQRPLMGL